MQESGLKYPTFDIKIKHEGKKALVFDEIRKKWIVLTPEEWVRQHLINFLVTDKGFPRSLLSIEKEIELNGTRKRYDVAIFEVNKKPIMLVECKSPDVLITELVAEQALRYNLTLGVKYLMLTNGLHEYILVNNNGHYSLLNEIPDYKLLVQSDAT